MPNDSNLDSLRASLSVQSIHQTTQDLAKDELAAYFARTGYGPQDEAAYKNDPAWQQLHRSAYPEYYTERASIEAKFQPYQETAPASAISGVDTSDQHFWNHHGYDKQNYMDLAARLPEVQERMRQGATYEELRNDLDLGPCTRAYYNPDNMITVEKTMDNGYAFASDGRHRIAAAQEMGYDVPFKVTYDHADKTIDQTVQKTKVDMQSELSTPSLGMGAQAPTITGQKASGQAQGRSMSDSESVNQGATIRDRYQSDYAARINQTPSKDSNRWTDRRGESICAPSSDKARHMLNEKGMEGVLYQDGVPDFSPFAESTVKLGYMTSERHSRGLTSGRDSKDTVYAHFDENGEVVSRTHRADKESMADLHMKYEKPGNFEQADILTAEQWTANSKDGRAWTAEDVAKYRQDNSLTWHECNDRETMQMIPEAINSDFSHLGGVSEVRTTERIIDEVLRDYDEGQMIEDADYDQMTEDELQQLERVNGNYDEDGTWIPDEDRTQTSPDSLSEDTVERLEDDLAEDIAEETPDDPANVSDEERVDNTIEEPANDSNEDYGEKSSDDDIAVLAEESVDDTDDEPVEEAVDSTGDESVEEPVDDTDNEPADESVDDTDDDPIEEAVDSTGDESVEEPVDDTDNEPAEESVGDTDDEPAEEPMDDAENESTEESVDDTDDELVEEAVDGTGDESVEEPVDDTDNEPAEESVGDTDDEPAEEPMEDAEDKPAEESIDDTDDEPVEEPVGDTDDEPAEEPMDDAEDKPTGESVDDTDDEPVEEAVDGTGDESDEEPVDNTDNEPAEESVDDTDDAPTEALVDDTGDESVGEPVDDTDNEFDEESVDDTEDEPAEESLEDADDEYVEDPAEGADDEPVEELVDKAQDESADEPVDDANDAPTEESMDDAADGPTKELMDELFDPPDTLEETVDINDCADLADNDDYFDDGPEHLSDYSDLADGASDIMENEYAHIDLSDAVSEEPVDTFDYADMSTDADIASHDDTSLDSIDISYASGDSGSIDDGGNSFV